MAGFYTRMSPEERAERSEMIARLRREVHREVATRLQKRMRKVGVTHHELERRLDLNYGNIAAYLKHHRGFSLERLLMLAFALGMTPDQLLKGVWEQAAKTVGSQQAQLGELHGQ